MKCNGNYTLWKLIVEMCVQRLNYINMGYSFFDAVYVSLVVIIMLLQVNKQLQGKIKFIIEIQ